MVIVGLLLVALVCLAVGLILPSTAWLIASLIASVGAGYVLFRARTLIVGGAHAVDGGGGAAAKTSVLDREPADVEPSASPRRTRAETRAEARAAKAAAAEAERAARDEESPVDDTEASPADSHSTTAIGDAPTELLEPVPASDDPVTEVSGSELLAGISDTPEPVEAESHEPAVESSAATADAGVTEAADGNEGDVWVIDGRPRYHLASCAIIQGQDAEPIPFDQATEDGFMPCSLCEPNVVRATAS